MHTKHATGIDTFKLAAKPDLVSLKTDLVSIKAKIDILDIDKLVPVPVDLSKPNDVVKNDVVKKPVYDKLVANVNNIDISSFFKKLIMTQTNQI